MIYIGIDVGGMSIKAGVVDEEGNILFKHSCPTGVERGYGAVIRDIAQLGLDTVQKSGHSIEEVKAIGIGIPGIMDQRTGIIPFCTNEGSGMGSSVRFIKKLCPGATVEDGTPIHGAEAANADSEAREIASMAK